MQWIEIENGIITAIKAAQEAPEGATVLPNDHQAIVGKSVKSYDDRWILRPLSERVAEGLFQLPTGTKLDGEQVVPMTKVEKIETGIEKIPEGMKIENGELVPMSLSEQVDAGLITLEEAYKRTAEEVRNHRNTLLEESDYIMMADYPLQNKEEWITYRQALRDIPQQYGFPDDIAWPEKPI